LHKLAQKSSQNYPCSIKN